MNYQEYLFGLIQEECGEISQAASKCNRFGPLHSHYEDSNLDRMQIELTDLMTVLKMLEEHLMIAFEYKACEEKRERILAFMEISKSMGRLNE